MKFSDVMNILSNFIDDHPYLPSVCVNYFSYTNVGLKCPKRNTILEEKGWIEIGPLLQQQRQILRFL